LNNKTPKQAYQSLLENSKQRKQIMLNLARNLGDILIAIQQAGLTKLVLGININYGILGVGGLTSSLISIYQLHQMPEVPSRKASSYYHDSGR